ncbi:MAG: glycosyltransferase [Bacteroidales bacterium]|nr:glycosyltransferase [Bacteroidales bacterium]
MEVIAELVFWVSVGLIFHSYVLFPVLLAILAKIRKTEIIQPNNSKQVFVSILMSAYNEEKLIEEKIESILSSNFNHNYYEILVGSDCSDDQTDTILTRLSKKHPDVLKFYPFSIRQGKPNVINKLIENTKGNILVLTDANVMFDKQTLKELINPFSNAEIGLVDTQMINKGARQTGISIQEKAYISREVSIKHHESTIWGTMMGPFGGCFAIRKSLFEPVPDNYLVDDFYLNMIVLEKGFKAINNPKAFVFEDVSNDLNIEYRRKIRIATGNFQNLFRFWKLLFPPWKGLAFSFLSHKAIRWIGPFLFVFAFLALAYLSFSSIFYLVLLASYAGLLFIPVLDYFLKKLNTHISLFRFITHFCAMNLALFIGFIRYGKGVKSNVWEPTKRNQ